MAVITKHDLEAAIAECQGKRNPDAKTCIMLAAFYTIRREMYGEEKEAVYSYAPAPVETVQLESGTDFAKAVNGRHPGYWQIADVYKAFLKANV